MYIDKDHSHFLLKGLCLLRQNKDFCDVELQVDGTTIYAHRVVLAAISSYFKAMFTSSMAESSVGTVHLYDSDSKSVSMLVDFAYTGHVSLTVNNVQTLLVTADMLGIEKVVDACCDFLKRQLHSSNCLGFFEFADTHSLYKLKSTCLKFILDHVQEFTQYDEFLNLRKSTLKQIVSNVNLGVKNEEEVFLFLEQWVFHSMNERIQEFYELFCELRLLQLSCQFLKYLMQHLFISCEEAYPLQLKINQVINMKENPFRLLDNEFTKNNFCRRSSNALIAVGGKGGLLDTLETCSVYNYHEDCWKACKPLSSQRVDASAAAIEDKVYVTGGMHSAIGGQTRRTCTSSVVSYSPITNTWSHESNMNVQRTSHVCVSHGGKLYVFGGYDGDSCLQSVEFYDPKSEVWSFLPSMKYSRSSFSAVVLEDYIFVLGGQGTAHLCTVERYSIKTNSWDLMPSMSTKRINFGAAQVYGFIYVLGGHDGQDYLRSVERFDPALSEWTVVSPLPTACTGIGVAVLKNEIFVLGGHDGNKYLSGFLRYSPCHDKWQKACQMLTPRCYMAVADVWVPSDV